MGRLIRRKLPSNRVTVTCDVMLNKVRQIQQITHCALKYRRRQRETPGMFCLPGGNSTERAASRGEQHKVYMLREGNKPA